MRIDIRISALNLANSFTFEYKVIGICDKAWRCLVDIALPNGPRFP